MQKIFLTIAGLSGALAVILGAFGAHALKTKLSPEQLQTFETSVRYQMYHTFALIAVGLLLEKYNSSLLIIQGIYLCRNYFIFGFIVFAGNNKPDMARTNHSAWRIVFIAGWILFLINFLKN